MKKIYRNQSTLETLLSNNNIHWILGQALDQEIDGVLFDWSLFMSVRFDYYLNEGIANNYYESKNQRVQALQKWLQEYGLDELLILILSSVIIPTAMGKSTCTIQQSIGYLAKHMPHEDPFDAARTAAELIGLGADKDHIYSVHRRGAGKTTLIELHANAAIKQMLEPNLLWINNTGFNIPLVQPPIDVVNTRNCGYHTFNEPLLLGKFTRHDMPVNTAAINVLNGIQWVIDQDVLQEEDIIPDDFDLIATQNRKQFLLEAENVQDILGNKPFWFAWQYDSRGRMYSHGYHINFQSYEYRKAMLSFNKYERLT